MTSNTKVIWYENFRQYVLLKGVVKLFFYLIGINCPTKPSRVFRLCHICPNLSHSVDFFTNIFLILIWVTIIPLIFVSLLSDLQNHLGMILLKMEMRHLKKRIRKLMILKEFIYLWISLFLFFPLIELRSCFYIFLIIHLHAQ